MLVAAIGVEVAGTDRAVGGEPDEVAGDDVVVAGELDSDALVG